MSEILVILLVAALFLGPEKLPEAATKISKGIRDLRRQTKDLTDTIEQDTQIGGAIRDLKSALRGDDLRRPPVRKPPPEAAAASAGLAAAAARAGLPPPPDDDPALASHDILPMNAPPADSAEAGPAVPSLATDHPQADVLPPADAAAAATEAAPSVTLPPTAGDPDRDPADPDSDDDDEHRKLAALVRPASGAVKRDGHGPN